MPPEMILFFSLATVAIGSALGMLFSRNAIYAALFLIVNLSTVAVFYLLLNAPFLAMAQITVYAGAIMVLFLFVIMLLGAERTGRIPAATWLRPFSIVLGGLLVLEVVYIILSQRGLLPSAGELSVAFGRPDTVGQVLFRQYLLPFEVTSVLLLVAMIGAIVLTKPRP